MQLNALWKFYSGRYKVFRKMEYRGKGRKNRLDGHQFFMQVCVTVGKKLTFA